MEEIKNQFTAPRNIIIDKFTYPYKNNLANECYLYRCKHRTICKVCIKISKTELIKYIENKTVNISYNITSNEKQHTCIKNDISTTESYKLKVDKKLNSNLMKSLILSNTEKPPAFHQTNLKTNNTILTKNQLKWALQKIRQENFPTNEIFLSNIANIKINLDNTALLNDLPFCYKYSNFINPEKKNV